MHKLIAFILLILCISIQGLDVPNRYDGFSFGSSSANVHLELFFDPLCPDCKAVWPSIKSTMEYFGEQLYVTLHLFPLPYHRYSFSVSQIGEAFGTEDIIRWLEAVFEHQDSLENDATSNMTFPQVTEHLAKIAHNANLAYVEVGRALGDRRFDLKTRASWKYGCYRSVTGTPTIHVNGVAMEEDISKWTSKEWIRYLQGLLKNTEDDDAVIA